MRRCFFSLCLLFIDVFIFAFFLFISVQSRKILGHLLKAFFPPFKFSTFYFLKIFWLPLLFLLIFAYEGLYSQNFHSQEEIKRILKSVLIWLILVFFLVGIAKKTEEISRTVVVLQGFYLSLFLPLVRPTLKNFIYKKHIGVKRVFIVGINEKTLEAGKLFLKDTHYGYIIKGLFDEHHLGSINIEGKDFKVRSLEVLKRALKRGMADAVVLSLDVYGGDERLFILLSEIQKRVPEVFLVPKVKILPILNFESLTFYPTRVIFFKSQSSMNSKLNLFLKNFIDILSTLVFLPFAFLIGLVIALLIKIDTPGPIFYTQERIGKDGKKFKLYKFRTMYVDAEKRLKDLFKENETYLKDWNKRRKIPFDPRITRIGKFLRRFSLDELPQFINILKGEMSLIGPRPVTEEELEKYYKEFKEIYYKVKPGLTGIWQVMGRNEIEYPVRVYLDVYYVLNWSIWLDIWILIKTIPAVISGKGAY